MTNYRDQFVVHWGGSKNAKLTLEIMPRATEHYFHYFLRLSGPKNLELFFEDIVGINVQPHWDRSQTSSLGGLKNFCYSLQELRENKLNVYKPSKVTIFHYPFHKTLTNKRVRKREKIYIEVEKSKAKAASIRRQENRQAANFLRKRILLARENSSDFSDENSIESFEPKVKSLLLLINPAGGKGKAEEMTQKSILPVLHEAGYKFEQKVTTHQGHAEEIVWFRSL